jgi:hypothetical protein
MMDVHGNDNTPEWGWCKTEGCGEPAEPLWFSGGFPDDPDLLLCYEHTGQYVGALRAAITEAHRILMRTYTPDDATPLHEALLPILSAALRDEGKPL